MSQGFQKPTDIFAGVRLSSGNAAVSGRQGSARRSRAAPMNGDFIAALDARPHRRCRVAKAAYAAVSYGSLDSGALCRHTLKSIGKTYYTRGFRLDTGFSMTGDEVRKWGVFAILSKDRKRSFGAGVCVSPEGHIVTCFHVMCAANYHIRPVRKPCNRCQKAV